MAVLMWDAYNLKDLQTCLQIVHACQVAEIGSLDAMQQELLSAVQGRVEAMAANNKAESSPQQGPPLRLCPECGKPGVKTSVIGREQHETCLLCRWGRYLGRV